MAVSSKRVYSNNMWLVVFYIRVIVFSVSLHDLIMLSVFLHIVVGIIYSVKM